MTARWEAGWLQRHAEREQALTEALGDYFQDQAERLAAAVAAYNVLTPSLAPFLFREYDEHDLLLEVVERPLLLSMGFGALDLQAALDGKKLFDFGFKPLDIPFDLPARVLDAIRRALGALLSQSYWQALQAWTSGKLTAILQAGLEQGAGSEAIARRIREELGGKPAMRRARRIARTETTGALNAGQQAQADSAAEAGLTILKTWSTVGDKRVRVSHQHLEGVTVPVNGQFDVGGTLAPYPCHWSLPTEQRVNCRCGFRTNVG
ncbi:MAG: phage minor head protein [Planctomycetaceae bacterium]|nr:phage minor head protein [Planctomycetaceae bacterium]